MEYVVIVHRAEEGGYWLEVPSPPGCFAQGETLEEVLDDAREAIATHLEALREEGQLSTEQTIVATISVPAGAGASA